MSDLKVVETTDIDEIRRVLLDPDVFKAISEDGMSAEDLRLPLENHVYLVGEVKGVIIGLMIYHWHNGITLACHIQVIPEYRKAYAKEFGKQVIEWAWRNTKALKIVAEIPKIYPSVVRFALENGFIVEGVNKGSYRKNGQIHDQWYLGLLRAEDGVYTRSNG